ncbi:ATP-binding protein [Okeania sp. SIO1I7]|uniref:ATP-binding protein n=1 Tax=Okeania sp. SIO1I7 TaxID=2607772 RepID=UPI0013FA501E|nr:ATP-binding protein [Okeania sp. SIO1I7]NET29648.1 ATP-binding protein [Okeania sp. SIO1I7]
MNYSLLPMFPYLNNHLDLGSTVKDLPLHSIRVEIDESGIRLAKFFEENPLLPGIILTSSGRFIGMISQQQFIKTLSRQYGREIFLNRSVKVLYDFIKYELLIFPGDTPIVDAADKAVKRPQEFIYEPVIVENSPEDYQVLETQKLLIAQSYIHQLAKDLLQKQTQAQLIQTEKLVMLGQMVAGLAHELRNPINCVAGNSKFMSGYYQDFIKLINTYDKNIPEPIKEVEDLKEDIDFEFVKQDYLEMMNSIEISADRMMQLVSSLRNFSHMEGTKHKETNINECLDGTLLILKNRWKISGVEIIKNYGDLPLILCHSGQVSQVFMNLITNALDALEEYQEKETDSRPGKIWIHTEVKNLSKNTAQNVDKSANDIELNSIYEVKGSVIPTKETKAIYGWLSIRIVDNGPGIPYEIQKQIFDRFFTTKAVGKGTGLGLAISYQIVVDNHQGKLHINSTPGVGTEFEILLPIK